MKADDVYLSAIRDRDGTVNAGYLVLFKSGRATIIVVFCLVAMGAFGVWEHAESAGETVKSVGIGIGSVLGAYGVLIAAIGGYLWGDSKGAPAPAITTTTTSTIPAAPDPPSDALKVDVVNLPEQPEPAEAATDVGDKSQANNRSRKKA